jgi:hypothetical protein
MFALLQTCRPEAIGQLELFRPEERVNQVTHNDERHDQSNYVFQRHNVSPPLYFVAPDHVEPRDYEKHHRNSDKYNVSHLIAPENRLN